MARIIEDKHKPELLLSIVDRYYAEKEPVKRPKYSELGSYARTLGYNIQNHIFQKSEDVRNYLDHLEENNENKIEMSVAVYDALDIDKFLEKNNTPQKLRTAIQEREKYYRNLAASAGSVFKKNKELKNKNIELTKENKEIKDKTIRDSVKIKELMNNLKEEKNRNSKLNDIIDTWVEPEIANELLKQTGLIKNTGNIIKEDEIEKNIVTGSTDIQKLINMMSEKIDNND